jgi:ABC-type phosphate transport system substrate-binding protein
VTRAHSVLGTVLAVLSLAAGSVSVAVVGLTSSPAGADTDPTTLVGQGGSFLEPLVSKLLNTDAANINPLFGAYTITDDVSGPAAFVGSGAGQFGADFTVMQRPLTAAESSQATTDGRSYAYVPFAATPVAIAALVNTYSWAALGTTTLTPSAFCQGIPLTVADLGALYGDDASSPLHNWEDSRIDCPGGGGPGGNSAASLPPAIWANLDPSMANYAIMSLLDSTPGSKADFDAGLAGVDGLPGRDDTPDELWPYASNTVPGGDQPLIGKLIDINAETNAPSNEWVFGATFPVSSVWTGAPLGVAWDIPTADIQNAAGSFVGPTLAAAEAAQADATLASTSDPTTDNLVTFNASTTDTAAYNNYLMEESYLVVPTSGLAPAKASALAQVIRFALGTQGQQIIENFGSAPATPAMQAAGLKVASELDAESVATTNPSATAASGTSGTGTTKGSTTTAAAAGANAAAPGSGSTGSGSGSGSSGDGTGTTGADSSGGLAFTGTANLVQWIVVGAAFLLTGTILRRRLKRRETTS